MAKYGKWIGGFIGLVAGGPLGALAGFVLGSLLDEGADNVQYINDNSYGYGSSPYSSAQSQAENMSRARFEEEQRNAFLFSLLVLASYIIRADGKVMHSEMNLVRRWLRTNFGENAVADGEQIILKLFERQKRSGLSEFRSMVMGSCRQLRQLMSYEQRLQLLDFLVMIAQADGVVAPPARGGDAPGDAPHRLDVGDGRTAVLLHDQCHGAPLGSFRAVTAGRGPAWAADASGREAAHDGVATSPA